MNEAALYLLDGIAFEIGKRRVISGLSLDIAPGRVYGLVGANGSGKSTLVKMLARQQRPNTGTISLFGKDIASYGDREFSRTIAYMPQFTPPAEGMNVRELVALGRFPWHGALGRFGAEDEAKVARAIEETGLTNLTGRLVDSLSGGERQRVWLAMLMAQDTRCLLLDEPTSALDLAHQVEMLAILRKLSIERQASAIIVLHDINLAARFCDEILALRDGALVARGTPAQIMQEQPLAAIYGIDMGILAHPATGEPISYVR